MKALFFILVLSISKFSYAQFKDLKIAWSEETRLTWEDFQGVPRVTIPFHANINTGLTYYWRIQGTSYRKELEYKVETFFYPELSWVHPNSKNEYMLKHEQLHFDISELHARKLRKELSNLNVSNLDKNSPDYLNKLYKKIDKKLRAMQDAFDKESNHSLNKEAELKWQQFVEEELNKFEDFNS